jgi:cysteinyl-tRNA synthetase
MKITDTLTGKKEEFQPIGDVVKMYVCGVTPYDDSHLGHAMSYIIFDVIRRYIRYRGYTLKSVQNVTDIDDKIINRANRLGITAKELAEKYTARYFEDMAALNVTPPDIIPRATEEIEMIHNIIRGLIEKGFAYPAGGSVYFRVKKITDYGKLSRRKFDDMMTGAGTEPGEEKEDPMDFVLWKAAKPGEPSWESPWGAGRPGWHIECSAMSLKYLGEQIDIHGGGQDLVFPHHENEITQSESYTGKKPFVKYWLHNGALQMGGEKMSKSLGNLITIRDALKKYTADGLRVFVLSSYYRSPLTYSLEALEAAQNGAERLQRAAVKEHTVGNKGMPFEAKPYKDKFIEAMDDDFNTSQALATLFDLARDINRAEETGMNTAEARALFLELGCLLGLTFKEAEAAPMETEPLKALLTSIYEKATAANIAGINKTEIPEDADALMQLLITVRKDLRKAKQFQLADELRNRLNDLGIILEDTAQGTVWKRKR